MLNTDTTRPATGCGICVAIATEICAAHGVPFDRDGFDRTGDNAGLLFKLHDFGGGVSSLEPALLGGVTHLANFQGTDTR